jgi:APA family basic amino acid/polyamine antiporter
VTRPSATLLRQLGIASATALVVSNMVGTGIFTSTGYLAAQLGSAAPILWIWVAGAIFALAGAFCYSELGVNFPSSGGEYVYLTEAFGPIWGFMTGWISFFAGFSAPIAAAALAFSDYVGHFNGWFKQESATHIVGSGVWELHAGGAQVLACSLIVMFTVLNCLGVKRTAQVQNTLTTAKVFIIVAFIGAGFAFGHGNWSNFSVPATRTTSIPLFSQFFVSLILLYTAYSGWNAATYVAEEIKQPAKTLPRSLALGTALVAILFVGLNVLFIYAVPLQEMAGGGSIDGKPVPIKAIGEVAASHLFGPAIASVFSAAMALSLMATVNAMVTIGPRVYYAMARNGAFFASAAKVAPRWHTPVIAIVCQSICAMLMTFTPFIKLLFYIGMTLNFSAAMSVASLFIFRRRPGWRKLKVVGFLYPLVPAFFIVIGIGTTVFGLIDQPFVCLVSIATVATGALVYRWRLRRRVVDGGS